MARALRELFAVFKTKVEGVEKLVKTNKVLNKLKINSTKADKQIDRLSGSFRSLGSAAASAGTAITAALSVDQLVNFATSTWEMTAELNRWSQRLNVSISDLRGWTVAGARYGASVDDVTDALKELQLKAQDALVGGTEQAEMFKRIGIELDDLRPRVNNASDLMQFFMEKLEGVNDEALRNFTVDELMSDAGTKMLPMFKRGSKEILRLRLQEAKRAKVLEKLAAAQSEVKVAVQDAKNELQLMMAGVLVKIAPKLKWLADNGLKFAKALFKIAERSNILKAAIIALGVIMTGFAISTAGIWLPIVALVLVLDDLITAINGGDSVIARFIDTIGELFGKRNIGTHFFKAIGSAIDFVKQKLSEGHSFVSSLRMAFNEFWNDDSFTSKFVAGIIAGIGILIEGLSGIPWALRRIFIAISELVVNAIQIWNNWMGFMRSTGTTIGKTIQSIIQFFLNLKLQIILAVHNITSAVQALKNAISTVLSSMSSLSGIRHTLSSLPGIGRLIGNGNTQTTTTATNNTTTVPAPQTGGSTNVNAGMSLNIGTINAASDVNEVRRVAEGVVREGTQRQARELQSALVPQ